jgi:hypothetical protein
MEKCKFLSLVHFLQKKSQHKDKMFGKKINKNKKIQFYPLPYFLNGVATFWIFVSSETIIFKLSDID